MFFSESLIFKSPHVRGIFNSGLSPTVERSWTNTEFSANFDKLCALFFFLKYLANLIFWVIEVVNRKIKS